MNAPCEQCHEYERQRYREHCAHEETKKRFEHLSKPTWFRTSTYVWILLNCSTKLVVQLSARFNGRDLRIHEDGRLATVIIPPARMGEDTDIVERWLETNKNL
jgi:hypothetical protein